MEDKNIYPKELSVITQNWFKANSIKVNATYLKDEISTHPDYPALTSLTDFLESGGMAYDAVQADASYINEFNYPLLAHIKHPGNEYLYLVNDASMWDIENAITQNWSGIALYATKGATWQNEENDAVEKSAQRNRCIAAAFAIAGIGLLIASIFIYPNTAINIFGLLSLTGLALSIAALGTELGYQSKIVKQVCATVGNGGCEKVLGSKYAKGFGGITPADASVLYFATQFILYIVGCLYNHLLTGIITLAFASIIVAVWSVYTQAVKVKEWCALCLSIVGVLIGQIIIATYFKLNIQLFNLLDNQFLLQFTAFTFTILVLTIIYLPIKLLIKTNTKNKQQLTSFKKWKSDPSVFISQCKKEPSCDNAIWENDLLIGNVDAPVRITVACNLFCTPCARTHKQLDSLLDKYPGKFNVQIKLLCDTLDKNDNRRIATEAILQKAAGINSNADLQVMITDWFENMDLNIWQKKWQIDSNNDITETLSRHTEWIMTTGITHTPTIFINGKRLPNRYNMKDIEKLIPQLANAIVET